MRIVIGSDERTYVTDALVADLRQRGHELMLVGPLAECPDAWPEVGRAVGAVVAAGDAEQGIVCCYTGTGVSIAANKVAGGVRRFATTPKRPLGRGAGTTRTSWP